MGIDSLTRPQKAIDGFQQDPQTPVFIGITSAEGTGNKLTAANHVFVLGLLWTPGLQDQTKDRAYRKGQWRLVVVKIPLVENTIDLQLWQMLQDKRRIASDLIEPMLLSEELGVSWPLICEQRSRSFYSDSKSYDKKE